MLTGGPAKGRRVECARSPGINGDSVTDEKKYFEIEERDEVLIVRACTGRVRTDEADQLISEVLPPREAPAEGAEAEGEPSGPRRVCINLAGVEFVDSGALAVLWRINENTSARFANVSELVQGTFKILGILPALRIHDSEEQALAAFADHAK